MSDANKAVFLSYAREDAEAAKRIADALRGFGVEVWFDMSELRGGDQWDQKIRGQIKACGLFIPVISATTQARDEAYFRLEWKLADDRSHLMASGKTFIVPVVIDDTPESGAAVPDSFSRAQWTRLPAGTPTSQFVEQVKKLLEGKTVGRDLRIPPSSSRAAEPAGFGDPALQKKKIPRWTWGALAAVVVGIAVALSVSRKAEAPVPAPAAPSAATVLAAPSRPPSANAKSIAVLPFANMSAEKENEFFADGVHDDVITNLAKIRDLKVISRTSVLAYRDTAARNLKKIAEELGVAVVLEGSVRRSGNKVRVTAQLIDARTDEHLWAETYDGDTGDIFALQAKLAQQIAAALKATLTGSERALIERRPTQNQEAYDLFLRARAMNQDQGERGAPEDFERTISVYEQAIAKDPSFALAQAQVALVHAIMYWFAYLDPTPARAARMKTTVDAAVRLAPDAPETHLALGAYHYRVNRDWSRALAEFRIAEDGLPNDAQVTFWLAITQRRLGNWSESLGYFERSVALNPRDFGPLSNYTGFLNDLRHFGMARDATARFLNYFPSDRLLLLTLADAQFALDGDRAAYAAAQVALPPPSVDPTGAGDRYRAALLRGDYPAADKVLADPQLTRILEPRANVIGDPPVFHRAYLAILRGESETARRFAGEAIAFYRTTTWNARQQPWVQMRIALAEAWSGRPDEALRNGQAALAAMTAQDAYDATLLRQLFGLILISLDRREEAITCLRQLMTEPCAMSPNDIRADPLWSRLKGDPRFEEILKSAKPL